MRRKPGMLVPLEQAICATAADLYRKGSKEFYGFEIAKRLKDVGDRRALTAYGTLYRALGRLETMGLLVSRWEEPEVPARENRPGRRLYKLTPAGEMAVNESRKAIRSIQPRVARKLKPA